MHGPPIVGGIQYVGMTMRKRSVLQFNTWFKYDDPLFLELSNVQAFFRFRCLRVHQNWTSWWPYGKPLCRQKGQSSKLNCCTCKLWPINLALSVWLEARSKPNSRWLIQVQEGGCSFSLSCPRFWWRGRQYGVANEHFTEYTIEQLSLCSQSIQSLIGPIRTSRLPALRRMEEFLVQLLQALEDVLHCGQSILTL